MSPNFITRGHHPEALDLTTMQSRSGAPMMQMQQKASLSAMRTITAISLRQNGSASNSRLFTFSPNRMNIDKEGNFKNTAVSKLFHKQQVGRRLNLSLFSSFRSTGSPFRKTNKCQSNMSNKDTRNIMSLMRNKARLATLIRVANVFEETLCSDERVSAPIEGAEKAAVVQVAEEVAVEEFRKSLELSIKAHFEKADLEALGISGVEFRKKQLIEKYSDSSDDGDRAFAVLLDLGMVEVHLDPEDPLYKHEWDSLYAPDNNWIQ